MTQPSREDLLAEGLKQARIYGVDPECARVYGEGWAAAMARADRAVAEMQREMSKVTWNADFNAGLAHKGRIADLERRLLAVLAYVGKLECPNCEHAHNDGSCAVVHKYAGLCRCVWGPNEITSNIRDLLKEQG